MNNPKDEFYRTLNKIVGAERLSNEETYIINDYVSRLEATHREEQKEIERLNSYIKCVINNIKDEIKIIEKFNTENIKKDYIIGFLNVCIKVLQDIKGEKNESN